MSTSDRRSERPNDEREVADLEFDFHSEDVLDKPFAGRGSQTAGGAVLTQGR